LKNVTEELAAAGGQEQQRLSTAREERERIATLRKAD